MKLALDDPSLNIKVLDVRDPDEYSDTINGVHRYHWTRSPATERFRTSSFYIHCKSGYGP